jgi:multiple sugar transport system substrate-binding protein
MSYPKKLITLLLALVFFGGLALPAAQAQDVVTLEWWTVDSEEYSEQAQRDMAAAFEAENPGIKVNVTVLPESGFTEKMTTTLGAGVGAPDVAFFWDNNWFPQALDLTPYIEADAEVKPEIYLPNFWATRAVWQDKIVGLPLGVGANFVMYNRDLFDAAGLAYPTEDWTTDQYTEMVTALTNTETKVWGGDRPRGPFRAIWFNYGAFPYSDDSMTVDGYMNGEASVAAYTWLWDLVNSGGTPTPADLEVLSREGTGPIDLFLSNRLAMATLNQGHMLNTTEAGMNFGIVPEPAGPGEDRYVNAWSLTVSIWSGTQHPDEAWKFLSYWAGPKGQKFLMDNGNLFPSIPSVLEQHPDADKDYVQAFFRALELPQVAQWDISHPCKSTVNRAFVDVWDLVNLGSIGRDEIQAKLDEFVEPAQVALDECRGRLGG